MVPTLLWFGVSAVGLIPALALAQQSAGDPQTTIVTIPPADAANQTPSAPAATAGTAAPAAGETGHDIVVTAGRLDAARASIQPSLGATAYSISNATIQALPGGDNQQFNDIVLQLPGVVQDGFGQFHVRDDHNGLQYRINGTILPEGIAVFGQTLSPRLIDRFNLITGAMPAQYGLRTAGIMDITTKSGFADGGQISLYGGSHDTIEPSIEYGGSTGATNYFVSGDFKHDALGIESVDDSSKPIHDKTDQAQVFAYVDHILSDSDRVSFVGGYSNQYFQIPNPRGLHPDAGWSIDGQTDFLSNDLDERQLEKTGFGQLAWLHDAGPLTVQSSLFARYSSLRYRPDVRGELLFNGEAQGAQKKDLTAGAQVDAAYRLSDVHTLRAGLLITRDHGTSSTATSVFPVINGVDADGDPTQVQNGQPIIIDEADAKSEWTESVYVQDEWKLGPTLTFNFGARFDHVCGYRCEQQLSPRANVVWQPIGGTTIHVGYARYFSPPPFENVATTSLTKFASALAPDVVSQDTTPFAERQNYFDVGVEQHVATGLTVSLDTYYRLSHDLIDEGQFGAPIILTPFNYKDGRTRGAEFEVNYARGPWLAYGNFAAAKAQGKEIVSSQFSFSQDDLDYIRDHSIYLDHDQTYTASAGLSYSVKQGMLSGLKLGADMIYGSGLRKDGAVPNGDALKGYAQFNLSTSYKLSGPGIELRVDIVNLADNRYEIRDGTGIGVGAPEYGPRRGLFVGLTKTI